MGNQIQGEILFQGIDSASSQYVYTAWMPVLGDKATFGIEILQITGSTTITWGVETRKRDDASTVTTLVSNQTATATGVHLVTPGGSSALELVRYRIATGSGADVTKWAVLRPLLPSWQQDR